MKDFISRDNNVREEEVIESAIRTSQGLMVPEVRASVRTKVSNLQPEGLPRPGKTTQGFRPSAINRRSSGDSSKPKSYRTIRNFWRRLEGADTEPPPRRRFRNQDPTKPDEFIKPKKPSFERTSYKKSVVTKPTLQKISAIEAGSRKSSRQSKSFVGSLIRRSRKSTKDSLTEPLLRDLSKTIRVSSRNNKRSTKAKGDFLTQRNTERYGAPVKETATSESKRLLSVPFRKSSGEGSKISLTSQQRISSKQSQEESRASKQSIELESSESSLPGTRKGSSSSIQVTQKAKESFKEGSHNILEEEVEDEVEGEIEEEIEEDETVSGRQKITSNKWFSKQSEIIPGQAKASTGVRDTLQKLTRPATAVLRPSTLWATLPRMFSDESLHRPSVILPILLEEEKLFHELVAGGDLSSVSDFLKKRPDFNINSVNYQGISALHIAVRDDNEDVVQFLLSLPNIEVGDSHLFAIRDNHPGVLRMILDKLQSMNPALEFMSCSNSPEFAENVTPLILAAEAGHYEIIGLLLSRGHVIPRPHKPRCYCKEECQTIMKTQDYITVSSGKLHIYRALSNPAYICQTTSDPLLTAFKLSKELLSCGHVDSIYMRQYEALSNSLKTFAVDLIAECRTLEEVEAILSESKDCNLKGDWTYPRLIMAMDFKQKEFVAHPNVQQVLERTWIGDWIQWRGYRVYTKALYVFPRLVTLPLVLIVLMFTPTSKWAKYYSLPVNKLLSNVASYLIFLLLVFIQSNVNKKNQTRDTKPTGVEVFLVIYVLTFIYNSIRSLFKQGVKRFFNFMWNIYELIMEFFFIMAFIFLIAAEIKTTLKGDKNLERKYWNYWDPELVSESFFVLATVMAFMRILLIFQISYHLGPLQVSLGKMTNDCAMFSMIFGIIIIAFTAGLCRFYAYYEDMVQTNPETGETQSTQENSFTSILDTFKTLFWGLFSMSSYDVADVVVENLKDENGNSTILNEHHLTEAVGYFAFAMYMILTVIVILNMLIATMSNTFQKVTDNVDTEWVFGKTEVYMSYLDLPVLPPPFNVVPTTHALVSLFKGTKTKAEKLIGKDIERGTEPHEKNIEEYHILMSQLVQRYFSTKHSDNE